MQQCAILIRKYKSWLHCSVNRQCCDCIQASLLVCMQRFAFTLDTYLHSHIHMGLKFTKCDSSVATAKFMQSQFESEEKFDGKRLSVVDALLLFYLALTLSSVRHPSLLMFDSSVTSLVAPWLILTLFCQLVASSSFLFFASSSWEIMEVSSASSVACAHRAHKWEES